MPIYISIKKVTDENINSVIFLRYLEYYGFDPVYFPNVLELFQSVKGSMSQFLKDYNQYLLSQKVVYKELDEFNLNGAYGNFESGNIRIPKTLENSDRILYRPFKTLYKNGSYKDPDINDFDMIIGNGISHNLISLKDTNKDRLLGICMDSNTKNKKEILGSYKLLKDIINSQGGKEYVYEKDTIASKQKTLCIVRPKLF